jgi:hypothetical protein
MREEGRRKSPGLRLWALVLALGLLGACGGTPEAAPEPWAGTLRIDAPARLQAGEPAPVVVLGEAPDGTPATLTVLGSYGPRVYRATFAGGAALFALPPADTAAAGRLGLVAAAGTAQTLAGLSIAAGPAASVAPPLVAPRSICAGGDEPSLVAMLAADALGNPLADGAMVTLRASFTGEPGISLPLPADGGVAIGRLSVGPRAGRTGVWAEAAGSRSLDTPLNIVACAPTVIPLNADPPRLPADGRLTATLRAGPIADTAGNLVADGALVVFLVDMPDGPRRIPAFTRGGLAEAPLLASHKAGRALVRALVLGVTSEPIAIELIKPRRDQVDAPLAADEGAP